MDKKCCRGFTLIELMIAIAIVGILVSVAYPAYQDQMRTARRSDGHTAILSAVQLAERRFTETNSYTGAVIPDTSDEGHYDIDYNAPTPTTFTLTATPTGAQASDPCGVLTINEANVKLPANCW